MTVMLISSRDHVPSLSLKWLAARFLAERACYVLFLKLIYLREKLSSRFRRQLFMELVVEFARVARVQRRPIGTGSS
jgi:hypothetical protein